MTAHVETGTITRKIINYVYNGNCDFIINIKLGVLKITLFSMKDYNLENNYQNLQTGVDA